MYGTFIPAVVEHWRTVPATDGRVEVSDRGRVRRRTEHGTTPLLPHCYGPG
jgi:hypothetical protein